MKKLFLISIIAISFSLISQGQITSKPVVSNSNCQNCEITSIQISNGYTFVYLNIKETRATVLAPWVSIGYNTYLIASSINAKLKILGLGNDLILGQEYRTKKGETYTFILIFPGLPPGVENLEIIEEVYSGKGFEWKGIKINNPDNSPKTYWTETNLKSDWDKNGTTTIEGIYENTITDNNSSKYRLGLKYDKPNDQFQLIYLSGSPEPFWRMGDIKAYISKTASPNLFKVKWYMGDKSLSEDLYITFEQAIMKIIWTNGSKEQIYLKIYPTTPSTLESANNTPISGTGFALSEKGFIVTNQHVIQGSKNIKIRGVKGNFSKAYIAEVVVEDKNNDLAILKIIDGDFTTLGLPPYTINLSTSDVGTSVFALGYPLRATMGDEVKLTNGIISSKSGFQGDITSYQISVPVQPGNSGGPLFDTKGNIVGIINAKHVGAENASYAIKSNYLLNLLQAMNGAPILPSINTINNKTLTDQIKFLREFVYIIEVN